MVELRRGDPVMKQIMKQRGTRFEQVPIELVKKVLEQQAPPAPAKLAAPAAVSGALAAKPQLPAALRGNSHQRKTTNAAGRALSRKGIK
jgi:hypothetical protein